MAIARLVATAILALGLVGPPAQRTPYERLIYVWHDGWYVASMSVQWTDTATGRTERFNSGDFYRGQARYTYLPETATSIAVMVFGQAVVPSTFTIIWARYAAPDTHCFRIGGWLNHIDWQEIECP
jgi:hypothetical protein